MARKDRFGGFTIHFLVPNMRAGVDFYSRLFGRPPDFEPHIDFKEWEVYENFWFQLGEGQPRPTFPVRFRVDDIEAESKRVEGEIGAHCSAINRIPGLVALCDFSDPWGNKLGFYQRLFANGIPQVPGSYRDRKLDDLTESTED